MTRDWRRLLYILLFLRNAINTVLATSAKSVFIALRKDKSTQVTAFLYITKTVIVTTFTWGKQCIISSILDLSLQREWNLGKFWLLQCYWLLLGCCCSHVNFIFNIWWQFPSQSHNPSFPLPLSTQQQPLTCLLEKEGRNRDEWTHKLFPACVTYALLWPVLSTPVPSLIHLSHIPLHSFQLVFLLCTFPDPCSTSWNPLHFSQPHHNPFTVSNLQPNTVPRVGRLSLM